jgi:hypothetical protein
MFWDAIALLFCLDAELEADRRALADLQQRVQRLEAKLAVLERAKEQQRVNLLVAKFNAVRAANPYLEDEAVWLLTEIENPELFETKEQP